MANGPSDQEIRDYCKEKLVVAHRVVLAAAGLKDSEPLDDQHFNGGHNRNSLGHFTLPLKDQIREIGAHYGIAMIITCQNKRPMTVGELVDIVIKKSAHG